MLDLLPKHNDAAQTVRHNYVKVSINYSNGYTREPYNCDTNVTDDLIVYSEGKAPLMAIAKWL